VIHQVVDLSVKDDTLSYVHTMRIIWSTCSLHARLHAGHRHWTVWSGPWTVWDSV